MLVSKNIFFLAYRYLRNKRQHASIHVMINICFIGILVATCALALVLSIMTGFEQATYKKMQSIYPDLIIDGNGETFDKEMIDPALQHFSSSIQTYAIESINHALLSTIDQENSPSMIILRGIDPEKEQLVSNLPAKIIDRKGSLLSDTVAQNGVLIGCKLAENLQIHRDDVVYILYATHKKQKNLKIQFQQYPVIINGIFKTGIEDFDASLVYCHQDVTRDIFPDSDITHIHLKLHNIHQEKKVAQDLSNYFNGSIYSWKDLYPTLLSALKLEKWAMFFILILIVFVASMNIISLIFMYVTQKQKDIIILLSVGMNKKNIRNVFLCISILIALPASIMGLSLAWTIGTLLQYFPCIKLPDNIYDTEYLPIQLELHIFGIILLLSVFISLMASMYATRNLGKVKMVELLKTN